MSQHVATQELDAITNSKGFCIAIVKCEICIDRDEFVLQFKKEITIEFLGENDDKSRIRVLLFASVVNQSLDLVDEEECKNLIFFLFSALSLSLLDFRIITSNLFSL